MRNIDRLNLIDRIGRELQSRMSYSDIAVYLSGSGVDTSKKTSSVNSKWIYVKELLADASEDVILQLADELEIEHSFRSPRGLALTQSKFWLSGHFRLFLSHLSSFKEKTAQLQTALREYGISAFVAHEDIAPTKEWQHEIENALFTMDALVVILTPGFKESNWTDQEVGVAVGRDVLIIPIKRGLNPYGFIAKYQGLQGDSKTISQVANELFQILASHSKTKPRIAEALVEQVLVSAGFTEAIGKLKLIRRIETLPEQYLEKLRDNLSRNKTLAGSAEFRVLLNEMLIERGLPELTVEKPLQALSDDDIPF
jgi:hypothetical protein